MALLPVDGVEAQPLLVHVQRLIEALDYLGSPLADGPQRLESLKKIDDPKRVVHEIQKMLDPLCLFGVDISAESRVKVVTGPAKPQLVEKGWRQFLVKIRNRAGVTAALRATSPQAESLHDSAPEQIRDRWLDLQMFDDRPLTRTLTVLLSNTGSCNSTAGMREHGRRFWLSTWGRELRIWVSETT